MPENTAVFIEKDDDLDFKDKDGAKSLASLKHKTAGDHLTDLSIDFWKSVRIWLERYKRDGRSASNLRFFLFTTGTVSGDSFLTRLLPARSVASTESASLSELAEAALGRSTSKLIGEVAEGFKALTGPEKEDFVSRIQILDGSPRIEDIPALIKNRHMRSIRREHRDFVFERIEGWWNDVVIKQLTGNRAEGIFGYEVSDKLSAISEEYKSDNLPITFRGKMPAGEIDTDNDPRLFVAQLREIDYSSFNKLVNCITPQTWKTVNEILVRFARGQERGQGRTVAHRHDRRGNGCPLNRRSMMMSMVTRSSASWRTVLLWHLRFRKCDAHA